MSNVLAYAPPPGKRRLYSMVVRGVVLAVGLCCLAVYVGVVFVPDKLPWDADYMPGVYGSAVAPMNFSERPRWYAMSDEDAPSAAYYAVAGLWVGAMLVGQWLFLLPKGGWRLAVSPDAARPMRRAAVVAGAVAMLISVGLVATLLDVGDLWMAWTTREGMPRDSGGLQDMRVVWVAMGVVWAGWALVFWRYFRTVASGYRGLSVVYRYLLAGTVLEMLAAGPAHAVNVSKDNCYCAKGSYTGLVFGATCVVWLFGPGVYLLFLREKRRSAGEGGV